MKEIFIMTFFLAATACNRQGGAEARAFCASWCADADAVLLDVEYEQTRDILTCRCVAVEESVSYNLSY